jgi:antagonist of KipI
MSLRIIKAGILDSIQDRGSWGHQHQGINPTGAMDVFAASVANLLVGNQPSDAVIELHFPASTFLFEEETLIALGGADLSPTINGEEIALWQPVIVSKNSLLQFHKRKAGARCYLAIGGKLNIVKWMNSYSTNLKAGCGGHQGRALKKDDQITFLKKMDHCDHLHDKDHFALSWKADVQWTGPGEKIAVMAGNEWGWLTPESQQRFTEQSFSISASADRMGYRLNGKLVSTTDEELISSAVSFGTIQLLPSGELIVLMADHQTTGGYPRIGHVISAHFSKLAQMQSGGDIHFRITDIHEAEKLLLQQQQHLLQLQNACTFKLKEFFHDQR